MGINKKKLKLSLTTATATCRQSAVLSEVAMAPAVRARWPKRTSNGRRMQMSYIIYYIILCYYYYYYYYYYVHYYYYYYIYIYIYICIYTYIRLSKCWICYYYCLPPPCSVAKANLGRAKDADVSENNSSISSYSSNSNDSKSSRNGREPRCWTIHVQILLTFQQPALQQQLKRKAMIICSYVFVSSEFLKFRSLKWLLDHPMNYHKVFELFLWLLHDGWSLLTIVTSAATRCTLACEERSDET